MLRKIFLFVVTFLIYFGSANSLINLEVCGLDPHCDHCEGHENRHTTSDTLNKTFYIMENYNELKQLK